MTIRRKPDGGYRLIGSHDMLTTYYAYRAGLIHWYDVRVWFACHEAVARRCDTSNGVRPRYCIDEITRLVGGKDKLTRAALCRLEIAGLLKWSDDAITFAKFAEQSPTSPLAKTQAAVGRLGLACRRVPVPRRTVRFIAAGARKVQAATMLGHLLRCCYLNKGACSFEGSCSAAWVAKLFGLDERNVKIARKQLVTFGWLTPKSADGWHRQRFGGRWSVNPNWTSQASRAKPARVSRNIQSIARQKRSPQIADLDHKRSPLLILKENSFGSKNQKPALASDPPPGFCKSNSGSVKTPTLKHVVKEDLCETARTIRLFKEAAKVGLVRDCEADRLKVVAAAQRALRVGHRNPCGLFASLLRRGLWNHITQAEEDSARSRLHRYDFGQHPLPGELATPHTPPRNQLSMDAKIVAAVKRTLTRHRPDVDPFEALHRERPEWTHDRWFRAEAELARSWSPAQIGTHITAAA